MKAPYRVPALALATVVAVSGCGAPRPPLPQQATGTPVPCPPAWTAISSPNVHPGDNELLAVSGTSPTDVWAVGYSKESEFEAHSLAIHWDGSAWTAVPTPEVPDVSNYLTAVSALAPDDVWAVGHSEGEGFPGSTPRTLTLHWDGAAWTIIPSPNLGNELDANFLRGVRAFSSGDVWAVGYAQTTADESLTIRWTGAAWNVVPGPNISGFGESLFALDGPSSTDFWAVGQYFDGPLNAYQPLFAHWGGVGWTTYDDGSIEEDVGLGVVEITPSDVWAVGTTVSADFPGGTFSQHWDGESWDPDADPMTLGGSNALTGVAAFSSSDVWTAGWYGDANTGILHGTIQHWDGIAERWTPVDVPRVGTGDNRLGGITAVPGAIELWAVGAYREEATGALRTLTMQDCPVAVGDGGFSPLRARVDRPGATVSWSILGGAETHRIVDATGLRLYDSGLKEAPASFLYSLFASGTYEVLDQGTGSSMKVKVPMDVAPRQGGVGTRFKVTWGSHRTRGDRVYDVQVMRPGSPGFEDWRTGVHRAGSEFVPDAGPGVYVFRSRLRNADTGMASGYSPTFAISVA
jgi:hypothetical protein